MDQCGGLFPFVKTGVEMKVGSLKRVLENFVRVSCGDVFKEATFIKKKKGFGLLDQ